MNDFSLDHGMEIFLASHYLGSYAIKNLILPIDIILVDAITLTLPFTFSIMLFMFLSI